LSLTANIIKETPVDTGRLRGNWQSSVNTAKTNTLTRTDQGSATNEAGAEISNTNIGDVFYMVNNLPYAARIENGYSNNAPAGMMRINVARAQAALESGRKL